MIIDPPSKSPLDATTPFPTVIELTSIQASGDSTQRNFYMSHDGAHDSESMSDLSIPPAVICSLDENASRGFIECYDRTGRIVKLKW